MQKLATERERYEGIVQGSVDTLRSGSFGA